jgi:hypothetical protein
MRMIHPQQDSKANIFHLSTWFQEPVLAWSGLQGSGPSALETLPGFFHGSESTCCWFFEIGVLWSPTPSVARKYMGADCFKR